MDLYIDKSNLQSLIDNRLNLLYGDILKLMKKQLDINFNFSRDELKKDQELMLWFTTFTEGVGTNNKTTFDSVFPTRPLKSNYYKDFDFVKSSSIYLLDDEKIHAFKGSGALLVGDVGEEVEVLSKVFLLNDDYKFEKKLRIGGGSFSKWEDLKKYSLPTSEIIVIDPYILKNKDTDTDTIDINFIEYLKVLLIDCNVKPNIIIVTSPNHIDWNYDKLKSKINSALKKQLGNKVNITLIRTKREHDRSILTNYHRIYSGDTFNFWNNNGIKISKGREISYSSIADVENFELARELINDVQKTINFLKKNNADYIEGNQESKLLEF